MDTRRRSGNPRRLLFHPVIAGRVATGDRNLPTAEDAGRRSCYPALIAKSTIGPRFRLVTTFDLASLPAGRVALDGRFPGLKPWARFCSPFGFGGAKQRPSLE